MVVLGMVALVMVVLGSVGVPFMGIKKHRILRRFQKYKLTLVTKCNFKKLFLNNLLNWDLFKDVPI
jgi:hypothetical protein